MELSGQGLAGPLHKFEEAVTRCLISERLNRRFRRVTQGLKVQADVFKVLHELLAGLVAPRVAVLTDVFSSTWMFAFCETQRSVRPKGVSMAAFALV